MPIKLTNPEPINKTITDEKITAFGVDEKNTIIFVKYDRITETNEIVQEDVLHTLTGVEVASVIARASELAGTNIRTHIKQALYEALPGNGAIS